MARANGEGTIYKRKDGRWCGQITVGTDSETGKSKRKTFYGDTRKEVAKKMTEVKHKLNTGEYIEPSNMKLSEWLNKWIEGRKNTLAYNTLKSYKGLIKNHINPNIGGVKLKNLKTRQVQELLNYKLEDGKIKGEGGLSPRTVEYIYQTLHAALEQAVKEQFITRNICKAVEVPEKHDEDEMQTWNREQVSSFMKTAKNYKYYILHYLAVNTGMRQGELLGLKWKDVNFEKEIINVKRQYDRSLKFKKLKSDSSKRVIPLADNVVSELKSYRIRQNEDKLALGEEYIDKDLIGCNKKGEPINHRCLVRDFKRIIKEAELPEIRFHDLRHTFATLFLEAGGNIKTLQQMLGHASINITIDTYGHVSEEMLSAAANKMEGMYKEVKIE